MPSYRSRPIVINKRIDIFWTLFSGQGRDKLFGSSEVCSEHDRSVLFVLMGGPELNDTVPDLPLGRSHRVYEMCKDFGTSGFIEVEPVERMGTVGTYTSGKTFFASPV